MNSIKLKLLLLLLVPTSLIHGQWSNSNMEEFETEIMKIEARIPTETSFSYTANYYFFEYENSTDTTQHIVSSLIYNAKSNTINFNQLQNFVVQTDEVQVACDSAGNRLIINQPNTSFLARKNRENFNKFYDKNCTVKKRISGTYTIFHLDFEKDFKWKSAEIWIEKKGMVKKYIVWTAQPYLDDSGENNKMIQPRMEVIYSDYKIGAAADKLPIILLDTFFVDIKKQIVQDAFKNYEVIDLRN